MIEENPLSKLIVSESQTIDNNALADLLIPFITIHKETKKIDFSANFHELGNIEKILILLSAIKARNILLNVDDKLTPLEIIGLEIMPEGSVKGTLKKLLDTNEIKAEKGKYFLPNYKISQVVARFKK